MSINNFLNKKGTKVLYNFPLEHPNIKNIHFIWISDRTNHVFFMFINLSSSCMLACLFWYNSYFIKFIFIPHNIESLIFQANEIKSLPINKRLKI